MATLDRVLGTCISPSKASTLEGDMMHQSPPLCLAPPTGERLFESEDATSVSTAGSGTSSNMAISINKEPSPSPTPVSRPSLQFDYTRGIMYIVYFGALVAMYPSLAQLSQLKFQNKHSPFETHVFLSYMSVVAYTIAIPTSIILFYVESSQESSVKECFSPAFYMILKSVYFFFAILAPLSLVLVLLIPCGFNWIGYLIVFALFIVVSACAFTHGKKLPSASGSKVV